MKNIVFIIISFFTISCASPLLFKVDNNKYEHSKRTVTILPVYSNLDNIKYWQSLSPLIQDVNIDNTYQQIDEMYYKIDETKKEERNSFFLILSSDF